MVLPGGKICFMKPRRVSPHLTIYAFMCCVVVMSACGQPNPQFTVPVGDQAYIMPYWVEVRDLQDENGVVRPYLVLRFGWYAPQSPLVRNFTGDFFPLTWWQQIHFALLNEQEQPVQSEMLVLFTGLDRNGYSYRPDMLPAKQRMVLESPFVLLPPSTWDGEHPCHLSGYHADEVERWLHTHVMWQSLNLSRPMIAPAAAVFEYPDNASEIERLKIAVYRVRPSSNDPFQFSVSHKEQATVMPMFQQRPVTIEIKTDYFNGFAWPWDSLKPGDIGSVRVVSASLIVNDVSVLAQIPQGRETWHRVLKCLPVNSFWVQYRNLSSESVLAPTLLLQDASLHLLRPIAVWEESRLLAVSSPLNPEGFKLRLPPQRDIIFQYVFPAWPRTQVPQRAIWYYPNTDMWADMPIHIANRPQPPVVGPDEDDGADGAASPLNLIAPILTRVAPSTPR